MYLVCVYIYIGMYSPHILSGSRCCLCDQTARRTTEAMGTSSALGAVVRAWDVRDVSDQALLSCFDVGAGAHIVYMYI